MTRTSKLAVVGIVAGLAAATLTPAATATTAQTPTIVIEDGVTQPVFDYDDAIEEVVYVEAPMDSDGDGDNDLIAIDVIRPVESESGMEVPTIMEASPYYGRSYNPEPDETKGFPGWWDEYFVPRGYAIAQPEMQGTGRSFGCPVTGGPEDTISIQATVDWLNGRAPGYYHDGTEAVADWSNGDVGMQGVSYVGTLPNAVATQGVRGLQTVVPIAAISSWYKYVNDQGVGWQSWAAFGRYTEFLANYTMGSRDLPGAVSEEACEPRIEAMADIEEANTPAYDYIRFWRERDYLRDVHEMKPVGTSVFLVHGLTDFNVKTMHSSDLWYQLEARDIPRKIWLHRGGHSNPASFRQDEWQEVMHLWMDHWLYRIENGIMDEPMADIQRPDGTWETHSSWPDTDSENVDLWFGPASGDLAGTLSLDPAAAGETQSFVDDEEDEEDLIEDPTETRSDRLVYVTPPLEEDLRISGTPEFEVDMSTTGRSALLSALIVDYGEAETFTIEDKDPLTVSQEPCQPANLVARTGCAKPMEVESEITAERVVARGHIDAKNYHRLSKEKQLGPGREYQVRWDSLPSDHIIPAGHRLGVLITGNYDADTGQLEPTEDELAEGTEITLRLDGSRLILPAVGGEEIFD